MAFVQSTPRFDPVSFKMTEEHKFDFLGKFDKSRKRQQDNEFKMNDNLFADTTAQIELDLLFHFASSTKEFEWIPNNFINPHVVDKILNYFADIEHIVKVNYKMNASGPGSRLVCLMFTLV